MTATDDALKAVRLLATALDNLCGRINQTLPTDGNYISFDALSESEVSALVGFSDECSYALDDPTVRALLATKEDSR